MSVATEVSENWPDHIDCADYGPAQYVDGEGIVCGCGAVLGYPESDVHAAAPQYPEVSGAGVPYVDNRTGHRPGDADPDMLDDLQSQTDPVNDAGGVGREYGPFSEAQDYDTPPWDTTDQTDGTVEAPRTPGSDVPDGMTEQAYLAAQAEGDRHARETGLVPPAGKSLPEPDSATTAEDPINARVAAIDPTVIYTPVDVERVLVDIERRLETGQLYQRVWERRLYEVSIAHELAWAKAIRASNASAADMRKADATIACIDSLAAKLEADIMTRAVRETMHNLRSMLSGFQSIARSVGASMTASGMDTNRELARYRSR
jgi:hypothetical protein